MDANRIGRSLPPPTQEQIAALAYAIWQDRGCPPGNAMDHWLEAERLLRGEEPRHRLAKDEIPADPANLDRDPAVDGGAIDEALEQIVAPPQARSPTSL